MPRKTLRSRIVAGLLGYTALLTVVVFASGELINGREEFRMQHSLLTAELDMYLQRRAQDPGAPPPAGELLHTYVVARGSTSGAVPAVLRSLPPGLHDDLAIGNRDVAALVRDVGGDRVYMTFDETREDREENRALRWTIACVLLGAGAVAWAIWWLSGRLLRPVSDLAEAIDHVAPEVREQRLLLAPDSASEVVTITRAMNRYLERMDDFVLREGAFIRNVSHEVRTPIAVIAGAADILDGDAAVMSDAGKRALARIRQTTSDMERLIAALLVLARSPERLRGSGESFSMEELVPEIVAAHRHLCRGKHVELRLGDVAPGRIEVAAQVATIAIANILRNAIENTSQGEVSVWTQPAGVIRVRDTGRGMSPEEIARTWSANMRDEPRSRGVGIGLPLIRHICEHLGWTLQLESGPGSGTLAVLDMRSSLVAT